MNEQMKYENDEEISIDLRELIEVLLGKWLLIILTGFAVALGAYSYARFVVEPEYQSTTTIYIYTKTSDIITYSDLQTGATMTNDYAELIKGRTVLEQVISTMDLDMDYETLNKMISVKILTDTRILAITVQDTDPYEARDIADTVRLVASENIPKVMGVDSVNLVDEANLPSETYSPNVLKYTLIGGLAGSILVCILVCLMYLLNDKITTQDDIQRYLGLTTLGVIPIDDSMKEKKKSSKGKKHRKKPDLTPATDTDNITVNGVDDMENTEETQNYSYIE